MTQRSCIPKQNKQQQSQEDISCAHSVFGNIFDGGQQLNKIAKNQIIGTQSQEHFYEQYKRVLEISSQIKKQINNQKSLKDELLQKIEQLQKNMENLTSLKNGQQIQQKQYIKKRSRRMAQQIQRKYKCKVQFCQKQYGSEGSLIQHIKLKHPQLHYSGQ